MEGRIYLVLHIDIYSCFVWFKRFLFFKARLSTGDTVLLFQIVVLNSVKLWFYVAR